MYSILELVLYVVDDVNKMTVSDSSDPSLHVVV